MNGRRSGDLLVSTNVTHFLVPARDIAPINIFLHQNMDVIDDPKSDIRWRFAPKLYRALERRVLEKAKSVFVVREDAVRAYKKSYPSMAEKFRFIPTWTDIEIFNMHSEQEGRVSRHEKRHLLGIDEAASVFVTVGRIDRQKDPLLLLDAFEKVLETIPNSCLIWVGDGAMKRQVQEVLQEKCLGSAVRLVGACKPEEVASYLRASDVFVLSSAYEGMPIALSEAMACGLPAVSTDVGEVKRLITERKNGLTCPPGDARKLAESMIWTMMHADALRGNSAAQAVEQFRPQKVL